MARRAATLSERVPIDWSKYLTTLAVAATLAVASILGTVAWRAWGSASQQELRETVAPMERRLESVERAQRWQGQKIDRALEGIQRLEKAAGTSPP
jgi:hypothetical protein